MMGSSHLRLNNRATIITDIESLPSVLSSSAHKPCVVMLTAWKQNIVTRELWEPWINLLVKNGCAQFVCVGSHSESLHDLIDDIILDNDNLLEIKPYDTVLTTYHDDETIEEVVNYFVYATELWDKLHGGLFAVLGDEDKSLKDQLQNQK